MTRTKIEETQTSEISSSMKKMNKEEPEPQPDSCQAGVEVVKQDIKEEAEDFTSSNSSTRNRKVIVKVVKVKLEHDEDVVKESSIKSAPEHLEYWRKGRANNTPQHRQCQKEAECLRRKRQKMAFDVDKEEEEKLLDCKEIKTEFPGENLRMTPEERLERRKEAHRLYQRKRRAAMTPEQRKKEKAYQKQYRQKYHQMPASGLVLELEELRNKLETCLEKDGEEFQRISQEKSELLREIKRKRVELRDQRLREKMTPEEFEEFKKKERERHNETKRLSFQRRKKLWTPEQVEKRKQRQKEYNRRCQQKMPKEKKEELLRKRRNDLSEEARARKRFQDYCRRHTKLAQMTEEEREEMNRRNRENSRKWRESLPPERLEKYKEYMRRQVQKQIEGMDREEYLKQMRIRMRRCIRNETPKQRQKRLRRYKVTAAVGKLKKRLKDEGLPPEEIKKQVEELKKKMWEEPLPPLETVSSYKPRPRRNPIYNDSDDVNQNETIPKRPRGRPLGSSMRKRTPPPNPEIEATTSMSPDLDGHDDFHFDNDNDHDHDHSLDSYGFHEDSSSVPATPVNPIERDVEMKPEVIIKFDLNCPHCPSTYLQKPDLLAHISSEHPSQCWKCPLCRSIILSPTELQEHFKAEHSNTSGATNRKDTGSTAAANATLAVNSAPLPPREPVRPATSDNKATGVVPFQTLPTSASKTFKCIKCIEADTAFECHEDLLEHFKSTHPESYWPCPKCNILKYTERSLNIHSKLCKGPSSSSVPDKPPNPGGVILDCRKCKSLFKSQKDLQIHVKYTHPESYWLCLLCNEWKYSERSLYRHKETCMVINDSNSKEEIKTDPDQPPVISRGRGRKGPKSKKKSI